MRHMDYFGVLPAELITEILEYLPIDALWKAAHVSRRLYAAAWRAGLFIHRKIVWTPRTSSAALAVFREVLKHAQLKDLRLSLTVRCFVVGFSVYESAQLAADGLFPMISSALPVLVYLSVQISDCFRPQLDGALRFPAPRLLALGIERDVYGSPYPFTISHDLFGGSAPHLREVRLSAVTLPVTPVPALRSVSHATVSHEKLSLFGAKLGRHFPGLTSLHLRFIEWGDGGLVLPDSCDIATLALRVLVIEDIPKIGETPLLDAIEQRMDLSTIPVVEIDASWIRWDEKPWTSDTAAFSMRVSFHEDNIGSVRVIAVPAHRRWRRLYNVDPWDVDTPLPIGGLHDVGARLAYLRIDATLLGKLLELSSPFPALRSLHIDMQCGLPVLAPTDPSGILSSHLQSLDPSSPETSSPYPAPEASCPCSTLEVITLFALDAPIARADSHHAASLAHALGQSRRPKADRAALALVGYEFQQPVAQALLDRAVSEIRTYPFAGRGSRADYDEGLWEPALSTVL